MAKDKNRVLDERLRRDEKNTIVHQERMVALEEKNRELVQALKEKNAKRISAGWGGTGSEDDGSIDIAMMPTTLDLQIKLQEAQRINQILVKSRDTLAKTVESLKIKTEKITQKYKAQVEFLQNTLQEKIKVSA